MVDKLELEKIAHNGMSRFLNPPQPMEIGKKINEIIDELANFEAKFTQLALEKALTDSEPEQSSDIPQTRRNISGKKLT